MSWFEAAGLANIAKSVQRTIDKALDIKDEDTNLPASTPIDTNSEDFFSTFGVNNTAPTKNAKKDINEESVKRQKMSTSIWGSFTGSFFDSSAPEHTKSGSFDSLDDSADAGAEHFSQSKLVVQNSDDADSQISRLSISEVEEDAHTHSVEDLSESDSLVNISIETPASEAVLCLSSPSANTSAVKRKDKTDKSQHSSYANKLSVVGSESGINSSESVDVLTCNTECTTSPESEVLSLGLSLSTSSSAQEKQTSDSVEIIDSLTSPSSIEIIGTDSASSRRHSQFTDEFISPLGSPMVDDKTSPSIDKISPDSVEVIPEDPDENSIAEDTMSYTSISESTSATVLDSTFNVHLKQQKMLKDTYNRVENDVSLSPEKSFFPEAITRAPSRTMHLPLTQVNQMLIDTQPQSSLQDISSMLKKTNVIDIPRDSGGGDGQLESSTDEGSQSDKTVVASDNIMESSSDTSTTTETSSNSSYLKHMLADAMTEKSVDQGSSHFLDLSQSMLSSAHSTDLLENITISQLDMPPREHSPISSESRSDLVKIGSDHTSGHTSGDELETTTSSDIEIISSPNGDSSSTQSRQSPAKQTCQRKCDDSSVDALLCKMTMKKAKGHTRELSEASSISDDSHSSEVDRLLKKLSEMTEILESRESKLIDINRRYVEVQDVNKNLQHQLDLVLTRQLESVDLSQVTEEYTQRMSALEKKFQQAIREKDTLRKQLEQTRQDAAMRLSKGELESLISEKDETIKELRVEGEKLSKQQLQHSNIIKKLRAKEKENEGTIKHLKERIESLSTESDRLKRSLTAKEEVERSQIEAVHQLTAKNKKFENEINKLQSQLDDLTQKYETVKKSLDAAKKELVDKNRTSSELLAREQKLESLENEKKMTESQNEEIINQLEDLRQKLRQSEHVYNKKEQHLRQENADLFHRLEDADARTEELSQSILEVSKPLVRQLESLQATHNMKLANFEKLEQELTLKIGELQGKLQTSSAVERQAKEESVRVRTKLAELEGQLTSSNNQNQMLLLKMEQIEAERQLEQKELRGEITRLNEVISAEKEKVEDKDRALKNLQQQLDVEKATSEIERKKSVALQEHFMEKSEQSTTIIDRASPQTGSNSPTISLGKLSVSESMGSSFWAPEESFDVGQAPRYTNMFEMQMLQTNLKQRDGELQQLQWELNRREQERSLLNLEISTLLTNVEALEGKVADYDGLKSKVNDLQQRYDTLCQLYGEKVEENEELKLDLTDVKDMYKSQIDELLKQQKELSK